MAYFLISVSTRHNLDLCIRHALAGFMNNRSGVWTFVELNEGDHISFLYGARAFNLYQVERKKAIRDAQNLPPWPPLTFRMSGKTYYFPFRVYLKPIRKFEEPIVRAEFAYVAENLLLRGGYRKTHFQADQTTLQSVSQMGVLWTTSKVETLKSDSYKTFIPRFTTNKEKVSIPEVFPFSEFVIQSLIRQYLSSSNQLAQFLAGLNLNSIDPASLEILGEKAFPEGHVDILIKEKTPIGLSRKVIVEVKTSQIGNRDLKQIRGYIDELGKECIAGALMASHCSDKMARAAHDAGIGVFTYSFSEKLGETFTYNQAQENFLLTNV